MKKCPNKFSIFTTSNKNRELLNLTTVIKASQALAEEMILGKLLVKLMNILIENTGAKKSFLLLHSYENWVIEAIAAVDSDNVSILQSIPIDSVDASTQTSLLPTAIINYVVCTQEKVIINDTAHDRQFILDPYIIATQPKSIFCTPLLNQEKLSGILYLENNLTTGVFTPDRIQALNILSNQAAISIENSRLYTTLMKKVEAGTEELLQTLEILEATKAKLEFEKALVKSLEQASKYDYQVGGSLPIEAPISPMHSADRYLYKALNSGESSYILNTQQIFLKSVMNFNLEEAIKIANQAILAKFNRGLTDVETIVFKGAWEREEYDKIAAKNQYTRSYISQDVAPKLWKLMTDALGERVKKSNFKEAIKRHWEKQFTD